MKYGSKRSNPHYDAGWNAERNRQSLDSNPYDLYDDHEHDKSEPYYEWRKGWNDAHTGNLSGRPGEAGLGDPDWIDRLGYSILGFLGYFFIFVLAASYLMAIVRWFSRDHFAFWTGFKELLWVLCPVLNVFYVGDWWLTVLLFIVAIVGIGWTAITG